MVRNYRDDNKCNLNTADGNGGSGRLRAFRSDLCDRIYMDEAAWQIGSEDGMTDRSGNIMIGI